MSKPKKPRVRVGRRVRMTHRFMTQDGVGQCCSCGWLCACGLRSTCRAEWETHVALERERGSDA